MHGSTNFNTGESEERYRAAAAYLVSEREGYKSVQTSTFDDVLAEVPMCKMALSAAYSSASALSTLR